MATFWQHFLENDVIFVISINIGNSRKPLEIKEKPKAIQNQLGHASAAMTLDVYADLFDDDLDAVGLAMDSLLLRENVAKMLPKTTASAA